MKRSTFIPFILRTAHDLASSLSSAHLLRLSGSYSHQLGRLLSPRTAAARITPSRLAPVDRSE